MVEKLSRRVVSKALLEELKKVKPERQVEILQLVEAADDYSVKYVRALVFATSPELRLKGAPQLRRIDSVESEELAGRLRQVEAEFKKASTIFRDNVFNLVKLSGYIRKLLVNASSRDFLDRQYPDILVEFEKIANDPSLNV